ncbi:iron complex transport system substrate-binding protein [Streptomyces zhaozhouensis]|uniref:Iron complex transport system substrate-binding protein n=1 Tax=Streptomyces zhaozhouensis TaxID=1300267 RepID=A0A286E0U0_9ACTN|nr:iron-siderophore ABC transporter substrate-binding protein [Streptomyces zhaozhouensis]SOD64522.1 iron complex transport system substrate-binding protein [Streptomyces zhaozhouensis]
MYARVSRHGRRSRLTRTGVGLSALLLTLSTACAWSGEDEEDGQSSPESGASGEPGDAFPVEVPTKFGDVTVPEEPQRVLALGWGDAETALALGVQPVGASDWLAFGGDGVGPWAEGLYDESPEIIGTLEPEYDRISELNPDLILDTKSSGDEERYEQLSRIAPTVGVPDADADEYKISWQEQTRMVATALGREERGEELIADLEGQFAEQAEAHPEFAGKEITVGSLYSGGWGAYVRGGGRVEFVEALGFENNPAVQEQATDAFSVSVSHERLELLDADVMLMTVIGVDASMIEDDPLYRTLPAVRDGRATVMDPEVGEPFAANTPLSIPHALEQLVPVLEELTAGG